MKVSEVIATGTDVRLTLEPENPAEIALLRLMNGCDAKCVDTNPTPSLSSPADMHFDNSRIDVNVKKGRF